MLRATSWLIRTVGYVLVGVDVFTGGPLGPVALPVIVTAYALCGVLLALWAGLDLRWGGSQAQRTAVVGLIAVVAAAVAATPGSDTLIALGVIATIDAGSEVRRTAGWSVLGAAVLAAEVGVLVAGAGPGTAVGVPLLLGIGLLAGLNRRAYRVQAEQNRALLAQAERLQLEQRRVAVLDERTRIAREIHDVLAHSLGALGIQIQAARALLTDHQDTDRAIEVLSTAQRMASEGLTETRRAVHALRTDTPPLPEELARMAATHELRHGSTVTLALAGGAVPLPVDQNLALVRTAQESLTNAAKHAPHRPVTVDLRYGDQDVTLSLTNPLGPGTPVPPADSGGFATVDGGYGLTGMRERLLLLGGTLTAGPVGEDRWTVTARVPLSGRAAA